MQLFLGTMDSLSGVCRFVILKLNSQTQISGFLDWVVEAYKSVSKMLESPNLPEEKRAPGLPAGCYMDCRPLRMDAVD
jgi:hypothetical protein